MGDECKLIFVALEFKPKKPRMPSNSGVDKERGRARRHDQKDKDTNYLRSHKAIDCLNLIYYYW